MDELAWRFNEVISLLREARLYVPDEVSLAEEIDEQLPLAVEALKEMVNP